MQEKDYWDKTFYLLDPAEVETLQASHNPHDWEYHNRTELVNSNGEFVQGYGYVPVNVTTPTIRVCKVCKKTDTLVLGRALNRTTKELKSPIHIPDYSLIDWIIDPDLTAVEGVPVKYWKITGDVVSEMNQSEKDAYDLTQVPAAKESRKLTITGQVNNLVDAQGYPTQTKESFISMYTEGTVDKPNTVYYIQPLIDWFSQVDAEVKVKHDAVEAATTLSAIDAISIDSTTLIAADPQLTIAAAQAIVDSSSLSNFLDANVEVTDPDTGVKGPFYLMQELQHRKDLYNDSTNPLYMPGHTPILGAGGILIDHALRVNNLEMIHDKTGWHEQEVIKANYSRPKDFLVYYGYLNSFNFAENGWSNEKVAVDMARYQIMVFGDGVQNPTHPDYANSQIIIPRIKNLNPLALIFGYVPTPDSTTNFNTKASQWDTLGVHGIFMDEAGYDYGATREQFNTHVDYVHDLTNANLCFANAWNTNNVLGTTNDVSYPNSTYNPGLVESHLTHNDWILLESSPINVQSYATGYESALSWRVRGERAKDLRYTYGINLAAVSVLDNDNVNGNSMFLFGYTAASMLALEAFGTSDNNYASSSATVKYWDRPNWFNLKSLWTLTPGITQSTDNTNIYNRFTENGRLMLNFSTGDQSSTVTVYGKTVI